MLEEKKPDSSATEETQLLEIMNRVSSAVAAELDLARTVQIVTDAATQLSGAAFGSFFHNVIDDEGEAYTLYALSGAPREAFAKFAMPRNTAVFAPTFSGQGIVRSEDITKDARYGKNDSPFGMPEGHLPVRSYLAAPVISHTGEVLGGLFFGHPESGVFTERAERIVGAIAVQAAVAIDKARLYKSARDEIERRKSVEAALRASEESLESKIAERTAELQAANARLLAEESRFRLLVDGVLDYAIYMLDHHGIVTNWNSGAARIKGYTASDIIGQHFSRFYTPEDRAAHVPAKALETATREGRYEAEGWRIRKDGSRFWASVVIDALRDRMSGEIVGFAKVTRDISERREAQIALQRTQEQLAQAQKMEGIGHLTGGVAHDFNNLLTIIQGNLETLLRVMQKPSPDAARMKRAADNAMQGAQRAAALTQRLLAFARQQPLAPRAVDASALVTGMSDLLSRSIGEQIKLDSITPPGLWRTHVDANQLEVAVLNLVLNARDAMPTGGKLTIETANAQVADAYAASHVDVQPGQYVVISVTDTGGGMTKDVAARAFEPFFTTKGIGHGTGLGLSQVYGFIKQSGGHVKIYSEPGEGTSVKLYLPRQQSAREATGVFERPAAPVGGNGTETILVVEDESDVRQHSTDILAELGYRTLEAADGINALRMLRTHRDIKLLFTDVGLPGGMNGKQLADSAREMRPGLKVLFTSGYAREAIVHDGRLDAGLQLITKPFTYAGLAAKLREVLDAQEGSMRVLLVEDEPLIRMSAVDHLEEFGFTVETAGSAGEAQAVLENLSGAVAAAIVDIGLPDRPGDALVRDIRAQYPDLPIVIASGHGEAALHETFKDVERIAILSKPYFSDRLRAALMSLNVGVK